MTVGEPEDYSVIRVQPSTVQNVELGPKKHVSKGTKIEDNRAQG